MTSENNSRKLFKAFEIKKNHYFDKNKHINSKLAHLKRNGFMIITNSDATHGITNYREGLKPLHSVLLFTHRTSWSYLQRIIKAKHKPFLRNYIFWLLNVFVNFFKRGENLQKILLFLG